MVHLNGSGTPLKPDVLARLVFTENGQVDITFRKLAESLISGPLADTSVTAVRCTTTPLSTVEGQETRYTITVHFPDAYNADEARSVRPTHHSPGPESETWRSAAHEAPLAPPRIEAYWGEA